MIAGLCLFYLALCPRHLEAGLAKEVPRGLLLDKA